MLLDVRARRSGSHLRALAPGDWQAAGHRRRGCASGFAPQNLQIFDADNRRAAEARGLKAARGWGASPDGPDQPKKRRCADRLLAGPVPANAGPCWCSIFIPVTIVAMLSFTELTKFGARSFNWIGFDNYMGW